MDDLECSNILGHNKVQPDLVFFPIYKTKTGSNLRGTTKSHGTHALTLQFTSKYIITKDISLN